MIKTNKQRLFRSQKGFSLLEILVAFSILAFSLSIVLKIFSSSLKTATVAEDYAFAIEIAESLLAKTGAEEKLAVGEKQGEIAPYYNWNVQVSMMDLDISAQLPKPLMNRVVQVQVNVKWGDKDPLRSVDLSTLRILPVSE